MKVRRSVKYANLTKTREEWYKKECDEMLFRTKSKINIDDTKVFLISNNQEKLLLEIDNPRSTWFLIWLKLKE